MNNATSPQPIQAEIERAISLLFDGDEVVEVRAFHKGKKRTDAGYFDGQHRNDLVQEAIRLNTAGAAVYVTLNRLDPQLLGRYANRIESFASTTASDTNVIRRRWLLVDLDPVRPRDTSATKEQLASAKTKGQEIRDFLRSTGWPDPVIAASGNGFHLIYPIDLANDAESTAVVKGALQDLAKQFDDADVKVDTSVFNAARIVKLHGTVANKGDHTSVSPWRLSKILTAADRSRLVTPEQLKTLVQPEENRDQRNETFNGAGNSARFDLPDFLGRLGIGYTQDTHEGAERYKLDHCPFNQEHGKGEAAIFRQSSGVLGFKCQHNSCADKHWQDVRALIDGARQGRHGASGTYSKTSDGGHQQSGTSAPEPLPNLPDVLPFDYDYLPRVLRCYVKDISERMQCPPDFAAVAVFVMMATIIGRKVGIRPMRHNDWTVICNLWAAVVGNSGVMKSPTLSAGLSPIKQLQAWAYEDFNNRMAEYAALDEIAKLQKSVAKSEVKRKLTKDKSADVAALLKPDSGDDAPILKRYMTNNASYEALGELLMENPNGLMVEADEIIGLLKQLDAGGQEVARSFYLTAADGDKPYTFDRIIRGKGLHIPALCLSIIGGIQPGVLAEYVRQATGGGAGADGLLQRFGLMVYPDISPNWKEVDRYPDTEAREAVNQLAERLDNLDPDSIGAEADKYGGVPFLRFNEAAQSLFSEWRAELETRLRSGEEHPSIISHLSKYRKLIPSLALINHLCDGGQGAVTLESLLRAIAFSEYLESHARRIYSYATRPDIDAAKTLLKRLHTGKLPTPFKGRDIYRAGWTGLETPPKAQAAISLLQEYGHLREELLETGGRSTSQFHWIKGGNA